MPKQTNNFFNKTILKTLNFILVALVGISVSLGSYIYFSQNYSGNGKNAQAALNCPGGYGPSGSQCVTTIGKVVVSQSYTCPDGGYINGAINGAFCIADRGHPVRHGQGCTLNNNNSAGNGHTPSNGVCPWDSGSSAFGQDIRWYNNTGQGCSMNGINGVLFQFGIEYYTGSIQGYDQTVHCVPSFVVTYSSCYTTPDDNSSLVCFYSNNSQADAQNICQTAADSTYTFFSVTCYANSEQVDYNQSTYIADYVWGCEVFNSGIGGCGGAILPEIISGVIGKNAQLTDNYGCPDASWTDNGSNCIKTTGAINYTIDINTTISICSPSADNLNSGTTFNCTFNLSGSPIGSYTIPSEGLYAGIRNVSGDVNTYLTNSTLCTVAGTVLTCNNIPTAGATVGSKEIVLHQPGVNWYPNKGTINIASVSTPLTPTDIPSLLVTCGASGAVNSTTICNFVLPPNKTVPTDFKLSIGTGAIDQLNCNNTTTPNTPGCNSANTAVAQTCWLVSVVGVTRTFQCSDVPTGNSVGALPIYGNLGTGGSATKTATGETVNIVGLNFGGITWTFTPNQGGTAPLFRNTDDTTININNFKTILDPTPTSNTRYTCNLEYRKINDRLATTTPTWTTISTTPTPYTTGNTTNSGCSFTLTKAMRLNNLNYSLRLTITDTAITNPNTTTNPNTYTFYNEYIYRFQGAGVASGG